MMRWKTFWASVGLALFGLSFFKNCLSYGHKSIRWRLGKSLFDTATVSALAYRFPILLVVLVGFWLTKPLKDGVGKMTAGVLISTALGILSNRMMECILLMGIFAVDLLTGSWISYYRQKMRSLVEHHV